MHPRHRPGASRTSPPSRYPSKPRGDFRTRPPNWGSHGRETDDFTRRPPNWDTHGRETEPPGYVVNKYALPGDPRLTFDDRGDRDDEKMRSEATRLAAEYFASKGNTGDKSASRGGSIIDPTLDEYSLYMDLSPPVIEERGHRGSQFSRGPYEETGYIHSEPKYDCRFESKFSSYREPEKVAYEDPRYSRAGLLDTRKYDTFGGRGNVTGSAHYENILPQEPVRDSFMGKYDSHEREPSLGETGSGHPSYSVSSHDPYHKDLKLAHRGEPEQERGGRGDRDDRGDRGQGAAPFSGDRKGESSGITVGRYDRNRREEPLSNKRKDRPFERYSTGDAYARNDFPGGKKMFTNKEPFPKEDLYPEQQRPPTYMTLLEAESSRRREDPDYGLEVYEFPTSLGGFPRQEFSRHHPPLLSERTFVRESRGLADSQLREEPPRGRDDHRREQERDLSREPPAVSMFGDGDRFGGHSFPMRGERLPSLPVFEDFDDGSRKHQPIQPHSYENGRLGPPKLGRDTVEYGFGTGDILEKKPRYSSYERDMVRLDETEPPLHSRFDLPPYDKGLPPLLDDRSRNRYDSERSNLQEPYIDLPDFRRPGPHPQRDSPVLSGLHRGGSGWRGGSGNGADNRDPPPRLSLAERLGPRNQEKPGFLQHRDLDGPPFCHRGGMEDLLDRNPPFEGRRPPPDFRGRDDRRGRGRGRGRGGFSPRDPFRGRGGPPPRKFHRWEQEGEMLPRPPSQAEELFRMHNIKAKKPLTGSQVKPSMSPEKKPPRVRSSKEPSNQDDKSDWGAGIGDKTTGNEKTVENENTELQADWGAINSDSIKIEPKPRTEEEKAMDALLQAQQAASMSSRFFLKDLSEDDDDDDSLAEEDEDEIDDDSTVGSVTSDDDNLGVEVAAKEEVSNNREEKAYEYFVKMFQDNHQLRKLYEENRNCGQFECLVCSAEGNKRKKKFPDVVGMVQHSRKVRKTKKIFEHRGYARAMCYLLGWLSNAPSSELLIRGCIPAPEVGKTSEQKVDNKLETPEAREAEVVAEEMLPPA